MPVHSAPSLPFATCSAHDQSSGSDFRSQCAIALLLPSSGNQLAGCGSRARRLTRTFGRSPMGRATPPRVQVLFSVRYLLTAAVSAAPRIGTTRTRPSFGLLWRRFDSWLLCKPLAPPGEAFWRALGLEMSLAFAPKASINARALGFGPAGLDGVVVGLPV